MCHLEYPETRNFNSAEEKIHTVACKSAYMFSTQWLGVSVTFLYVGHDVITFSRLVFNPACGQLNREKTNFPFAP